jgi:hypothetical protein
MMRACGHGYNAVERAPQASVSKGDWADAGEANGPAKASRMGRGDGFRPSAGLDFFLFKFDLLF